MDSMPGKRFEIPNDDFPQTKIRNVCCVRCKHCFVVQDFTHLRGPRIPFLLECGHPICHGCLASGPLKFCPLCKGALTCTDNHKVLSSVNVYALGLMLAVSKRPIQTKEPDISFQQRFNSQLWQTFNQGKCQECGVQAAVRCLQCAALYCSACYAKIHGRALQSHQKVALLDSISHIMAIRNVCSDTCGEPPGYFCNDCSVSCCPHCILRSHVRHNYMSLQEKNKQLMPVFNAAYDKVAECYQQVLRTQKKLETISTFPSELQNSEAVEATVNQHFLYLHGLLQNLEKRLINELRHQRDYLSKRLDDINVQLQMQKEQLQTALLIATSASESSDKVDIQEVIRKLEEAADLPCHLVQEPIPKDDKIEFEIDKTIVEAIEKHCTIQVPAISCLNLMPTRLLPEDYEMEPLTQEINIPKLSNKPALAVKPAAPAVSVVPRIAENIPRVLSQGTSVYVRVTHIVDPLCFYVQQLNYEANLKQLNADVAAYAKCTTILPSEVIQNKLYVVQRKADETWHRGRVTKISSGPDNEERYKIFYVDDGTDESNVSAVQMRNVSPQISTPPMMAIKCSLHNIVPADGKWQQGAIEAFWELVQSDAVILMHIVVIRGNTYYVDICVNRLNDPNGPVSVRDALIFKGFGSFHSWNNLMRTNPRSMQQFYSEELELEKFVDVVVQYVESPESIYVIKEENTNYLQKILNNMAEDYEKDDASKGVIYVPEEKFPCAARGVDGIWYRAIISEVLTEREVKIFFVDLGYTLIVDYSELRKLSPNYMITPTQAIKVCLKNVQPLPQDKGRWNARTIEFAKQYLSDKMPIKVFPFKKIRNAYSSQLYVKDGLDFGNMLICGTLAQSVGTGSKRYAKYPLQALPAANQSVNRKKDDKKKSSQKKRNSLDDSYISRSIINPLSVSRDEPDPFKICVHIRKITSPDCIYVSEKSREQSNAELMSSMQQFYNKYHSKEQEIWEEGAVCAVYSAKDKSYFRAKILAIKSTEEVNAFFFDLAINEVVSLKNIQTLHPQFLQTSAYLFKVKLAGIFPCGGSTTWPSLSCESLQNIVSENQNCKFYISKAEETAGDAIPVELWVKQSKTEGPLLPTTVEINCINRMLVDKGVALPIKNYAQKKDKILAIELKRELNKKNIAPIDPESNVKWFSIDDGLNASGLDQSYRTVTDSQPDVASMDTTTSESDSNEIYTLLTSDLSKWKPPEPITQTEFIGIPTYVDHDCAVYVYSKTQNGKTLRLIESKLDNYYAKKKLRTCDMVWKEGDICIAQYHFNKKWYRAKVIKLLESDMVQVLFVDYGNVEDCEIGTLLKRVILSHIPIQCTKCIIRDLRPGTADGKWPIHDLDIIHALLVENECKFTILERKSTHLIVNITLLKPYKCDLISYLVNELGMNVNHDTDDLSEINACTEEDTSSANTAEVIIEGYVTCTTESKKDKPEELTSLDSSLETREFNDAVISGHSMQIQKHNNENSESKVTVDFDNVSWSDFPATLELVSSTPQNELEEDVLTQYMPLRIPNDTDTLDVEVCFIFRPTVYFVQLRENGSQTFGNIRCRYELLMADMQTNANSQPLIESLTCNALCCARFRDDRWYRCLIKECIPNPMTDDLEVLLLYVDFGNEEIRTIDRNDHNLRTLKKEWLNVPAMAIKCHLWDVEVLCDADSYHILVPTLEKLYDMLLTAKVKEIQDNVLWIELYTDKSCTKLAYSSLIEDGHFCPKKSKETSY